MTSASDTIATAEAARLLRRARRFARINKAAGWLDACGSAGCAAAAHRRGRQPERAARRTEARARRPARRHRHLPRSPGRARPARARPRSAPCPGRPQVWEQALNALGRTTRARASKEAEFYERQDGAQRRAARRSRQARRGQVRNYTGKPTYLRPDPHLAADGALGFVIATLIAVPLGIVCGLSPTVNGAINPLIQIFKPVSPLAWLPIVTMVVSARLRPRPGDVLPKIASDLGDHGDALLALADADQHRARRRLDRQGPGQRRPRAAALDAGRRSPSSCCPRRCR